MKKKLMVIALAVLTVLMFAACGKNDDETFTTLKQDIAEDGKSCTVEAKDAGEGDYTVSGTMIVEEGQKLQIVSDIEGDGTITLEFSTNEELDSLDENASSDELENAANSYKPELTVEAGGSDIASYDIAPGEYYVKAITTKGCTGTVKVTVA